MEKIIYDSNDVKITAKGIEYNGLFGPELLLFIENNSLVNLTVQARNTSINGIMIEPIFSADVAAGKKINDSMTFFSSDLESSGIHTISDLEFSLVIFNSDTWDDIVESDLILLSSNESNTDQRDERSGVLVFDVNDIQIYIGDLNEKDSIWGPEISIQIENDCPQNITIQARDVSINGYMVDPIFSCDVMSGKTAYDTITFFESDLTDNNISSIEEVELSFHVFDSNSWESIVDSGIIKVSF